MKVKKKIKSMKNYFGFSSLLVVLHILSLKQSHQTGDLLFIALDRYAESETAVIDCLVIPIYLLSS